MIRINLLPFRAARKRENIRRQVHVFFLCLAFLLALAAYFHIDLNGKLDQLTSKKERLQKELQSYQKLTREIAKLKSETEKLNRKLGVIEKLENQRKGPVELLVEIARAVPLDRLWLDSLSETGRTLTLQGTAMDNDTVALFMTELEKGPRIRSVDLDKTMLRSFPKHKLRAAGFVLTGLIADDKPEPVPKKPEKPQRRR